MSISEIQNYIRNLDLPIYQHCYKYSWGWAITFHQWRDKDLHAIPSGPIVAVWRIKKLKTQTS